MKDGCLITKKKKVKKKYKYQTMCLGELKVMKEKTMADMSERPRTRWASSVASIAAASVPPFFRSSVPSPTAVRRLSSLVARRHTSGLFQRGDASQASDSSSCGCRLPAAAQSSTDRQQISHEDDPHFSVLKPLIINAFASEHQQQKFSVMEVASACAAVTAAITADPAELCVDGPEIELKRREF